MRVKDEGQGWGLRWETGAPSISTLELDTGAGVSCRSATRAPVLVATGGKLAAVDGCRLPPADDLMTATTMRGRSLEGASWRGRALTLVTVKAACAPSADDSSGSRARCESMMSVEPLGGWVVSISLTSDCVSGEGEGDGSSTTEWASTTEEGARAVDGDVDDVERSIERSISPAARMSLT